MTRGTDPDRRSNRPRTTRRRFLLGAAATAIAGGVAGCGGGSSGERATATPTASSVSLPYTATSEEGNVARARSLSVHNDNTIAHEVSLQVTEKPTGKLIFRTTTEIPKGSERTFEDLIRRKGTYEIHIRLAIGIEKTYEWPIDGEGGDAGITIAEGKSPTSPNMWFSLHG